MRAETNTTSHSILTNAANRVPIQCLHMQQQQVVRSAENVLEDKQYDYRLVEQMSYARFQIWVLYENNRPVRFEVGPLCQGLLDFSYY